MPRSDLRTTSGGSAAAARRAALGAALLLVAGVTVPWATGPGNRGQLQTQSSIALRIDPNTASREELMLLPRVGPMLAAAIIQYRQTATQRPAFARAEDLDRVRRIGPKTVELLRPFLIFPEAHEESRELAARR